MNLFIIIVVVSIVNVEAAHRAHQDANDYFESDPVKVFEKKWNPYAFTYENAIAYTLKGDYGHKTLNVYINRFHKPLFISSGYFHSDNQVNLVFKDILLEALPNLYEIDLSIVLPSNVVLLEASVSKMIVQTSYILFRNQSDIIFSPAQQDSYQNSPFRFQQVRNTGDLAITIEGCILSGMVVASLSGNSVNLGHSEMRLSECQYSFEVYKQGSASPPVIANYLPKGDIGLNLDTLLTRSILEELVPKLQGAFFSEVNMSTVLTDDLARIRSNQEIFFDDAKNCMEDITRSMNKKSMERSMGTADLCDFSITWDDTFTELPAAKSINLYKMTLLGLDTVYSSHSGGPVRLPDVEIMDQLRFSTLQVVGKVSIEGFNDESEFAVEIRDLAVDVNIDTAHKMKLDVLGWRFLEFSCPDLEFLPAESLVVGYLLKEVPKHVKSHLESVYDQKIVNLKQEYDLHETADIINESDEIFKTEKLNQVISREEEEEVVASPYQAGQETVKLHHIEVVPHTDDNDPLNPKRTNLMLSDAKQKEYEEVKLHHVGVEPYRDESDPLHPSNQFLQLNDAQKKEYDQVKVHHVGVEPYRDESDPLHPSNRFLQLNDAQKKEYDQVKVHHVGVEPYREDDDPLNPNQKHLLLNDVQKQEYDQVKIHHVGVEPQRDLEDPLHPYNTVIRLKDAKREGGKDRKMSRKRLAKRKSNVNRKMFTKPIHKPTRRIKFARDRRANKLSPKTAKSNLTAANKRSLN